MKKIPFALLVVCLFPLIKLAKKLKDAKGQSLLERIPGTFEFPLIKLAKKLKEQLFCPSAPSMGLFPLIKLAKKLKVLVFIVLSALGERVSIN